MHRRSLILLVLLACARVAAADPDSARALGLVVFDERLDAPAFEAASLARGPVSLQQFRGKVVLLNFWATWCPPCLHEMPAMEALYQRFRERGMTVLALSSDREGAAHVADFVHRLGVTFPILLDPHGRVSATYGARNLPVSFLLDARGQVVAAAEGARDWASPAAYALVESVLGNR